MKMKMKTNARVRDPNLKGAPNQSHSRWENIFVYVFVCVRVCVCVWVLNDFGFRLCLLLIRKSAKILTKQMDTCHSKVYKCKSDAKQTLTPATNMS